MDWCTDGVVQDSIEESNNYGNVASVPDGGGAIDGLTMYQHLEWANGLPHTGHKAYNLPVDEGLGQAVILSSDNPPEEIDQFRFEFVAELFKLEVGLLADTSRWLNEVDEERRGMLQDVHGPLLQSLEKWSQHEDPSLAHDIKHGFEMVGKATAGFPSSRWDEWSGNITPEEVWSNLQESTTKPWVKSENMSSVLMCTNKHGRISIRGGCVSHSPLRNPCWETDC